MMRWFSAIAVLALPARGALGQATSQATDTAAPVGTWRGTSVCLVRPSACTDEIVVYRFARLEAADSLAMDGRKIVGGQEQDMGMLTCRFVASTAEVTCVVPQGVWQFRVQRDTLVGELRLPDHTRFREVRATRVP